MFDKLENSYNIGGSEWGMPPWQPFLGLLSWYPIMLSLWNSRAQHIPLPDGLGPVKLSVGQFFYILYMQIIKMHNFGSLANRKSVIHQALNWFEDLASVNEIYDCPIFK